jgi:hypothetical protein
LDLLETKFFISNCLCFGKLTVMFLLSNSWDKKAFSSKSNLFHFTKKKKHFTILIIYECIFGKKLKHLLRSRFGSDLEDLFWTIFLWPVVSPIFCVHLTHFNQISKILKHFKNLTSIRCIENFPESSVRHFWNKNGIKFKKKKK